ncbi:MAG TPA: Crp/Fnr family transcriptional regulator [Gammaproteobacteria bacterium]|nr:Crp/Fnr family transcriptional regulator [Gammaproteobacteria bacterium]
MRNLDKLKYLDLYVGLSESGKEQLAQGAVLIDCPDSSGVLCKGEAISGAYLVLSGRLRVFTMTPNGNEATLYFIHSGETCVLALNCLFNDLLYPAWVAAESETTVAHIPGKVYRALFERESAVQDLTVRTLSTLVFRLMGEMELIHSCHHRQRLANFILLHASSNGILKMTQQQIAGHLGTTREVIARLLQGFVAMGYVKTRRGELAIQNIEGLRDIISET